MSCYRFYVVAVLLFDHTLLAASHEFDLHAFGVSKSRVTIEVDEEILAPLLSSSKLSPEVMQRIVPYSTSDEGQAIIKDLLAKPELSLGHSVVYFYLAINHAFSRVYRSLLLQEGMKDRPEAEREFIRGLDQQEGSKQEERDVLFRNLRDVARIPAIVNKTIRLQVFFDRSKFDQAAATVGLHGTKAFWDPSRWRIGFYFDAKLFRWYRERGGREGQSVIASAEAVRDYVIRQALESITHEVVHLIQRSDSDFLDGRPFLAEGVALLVQSNVSMREEFNRLTVEQSRRGISLMPAPGSPCRVLMESAAPMYSGSLIQLQNGIGVAKDKFPLARVLSLDERQFYAQDTATLKKEYDAALAFTIFIAGLPRERFAKDVEPLLDKVGGKMSSMREALNSLEYDFSEWARSKADWEANDANEDFGNTQLLTSACLGARQYLPALMGSGRMFLLNPLSPTSFLYAGDVYFRVNMPFFALDYYTLSKELHDRSHNGDEPPARIYSRLADAFEQIGDISSALQYFAKSNEIGSTRDDLQLTLLRNKIKVEFYNRALAAGYARQDDALYLLNSYVEQFQGSGCARQTDRDAIRAAVTDATAGDSTAFRKAVTVHYVSVLDQMRLDMTGKSLDEILKLRSAYCSGN